MATCSEEPRPSTRYSLPLRLTSSMRVTLPPASATWLTRFAGLSVFLLELPPAWAAGIVAMVAAAMASVIASADLLVKRRNLFEELLISVSRIVVSPWNLAACVRYCVAFLLSYVRTEKGVILFPGFWRFGRERGAAYRFAEGSELQRSRRSPEAKTRRMGRTGGRRDGSRRLKLFLPMTAIDKMFA